MESTLDTWAVVLVGQWNRKVFSSAWVAHHLFGDKPLVVELRADNPQEPPRYSVGDVRLLVTPTKVTVFPVSDSEASLRQVEETAVRVLKLLPHTPLQGVGVNFRFVESSPTPELTRLFQAHDIPLLAEKNLQATHWAVRRHLTRDDFELRLQLSLSDEKVTFDFNFNRDVTDCAVAAEYLTGRVVRCRALVEEVLPVYSH